jgi:hypothetical protein
MKNLACKLLLPLVVCFTVVSSTAYAEAQIKEVCRDKAGKDGKPITDKNGKVVQECKKIKVHKKLEGTEVPVKK